MSATIVTSTSHVSPGHGTINRTASPSNQENAGASSNMESVGGFVNKPARGWLHPDHLFAKDGINYNVRVRLSQRSIYAYSNSSYYSIHNKSIINSIFVSFFKVRWMPGGEYINESSRFRYKIRYCQVSDNS